MIFSGLIGMSIAVALLVISQVLFADNVIGFSDGRRGLREIAGYFVLGSVTPVFLINMFLYSSFSLVQKITWRK
jgi:hypothetical protein